MADSHTIAYHRRVHAAHSQFGCAGWDLEIWTVPAGQLQGVPADAEYCHGYMEKGRDFSIYTRRAPLTPGRCSWAACGEAGNTGGSAAPIATTEPTARN